MTQLLSALAYMHRRGFIHRDLKPAVSNKGEGSRRAEETDYECMHARLDVVGLDWFQCVAFKRHETHYCFHLTPPSRIVAITSHVSPSCWLPTPCHRTCSLTRRETLSWPILACLAKCSSTITTPQRYSPCSTSLSHSLTLTLSHCVCNTMPII